MCVLITGVELLLGDTFRGPSSARQSKSKVSLFSGAAVTGRFLSPTFRLSLIASCLLGLPQRAFPKKRTKKKSKSWCVTRFVVVDINQHLGNDCNLSCHSDDLIKPWTIPQPWLSLPVQHFLWPEDGWWYIISLGSRVNYNIASCIAPEACCRRGLSTAGPL